MQYMIYDTCTWLAITVRRKEADLETFSGFLSLFNDIADRTDGLLKKKLFPDGESKTKLSAKRGGGVAPSNLICVRL